jgi:hypothetical protein
MRHEIKTFCVVSHADFVNVKKFFCIVFGIEAFLPKSKGGF